MTFGPAWPHPTPVPSNPVGISKRTLVITAVVAALALLAAGLVLVDGALAGGDGGALGDGEQSQPVTFGF